MEEENLSLDSERLETIIKLFKVTKNNFAKKLGYKSSMSIYNILSGDRPITEDMALRIVKHYPQVNFMYVTQGIGDPLREGFKEQLQENVYNILENPKADSEKLDEILRRITMVEKLLLLSLENKKENHL
jgi:hypothetical protein